MTPNPSNRRTVLKITGAALAGVGTTGLVGADPGNDNAPFAAQARSVTRATAKYGDLQKALRDGFEIMGPYVPDMGWHLVNFDRIERAAHRGINIRKPQALTYNLEVELGSVEYIVPLDGDAPDVFNDEGEGLDVPEAAGWHPHHGAQHVFADGDGEVTDRGDVSLAALLDPANWTELSDEDPAFPPEQPNLEPGDELTAPFPPAPGVQPETRTVDFVIEHGDWWTLHAWFHFDNPEGLFAGFNHADDWDPLQAPPHH